MINIGVCFFKAPIIWIQFKILHHVFMDTLLKVDAQFAIGTYYDIGADSLVSRDIAVWIIDAKIRRVVPHLLMRQLYCDVG